MVRSLFKVEIRLGEELIAERTFAIECLAWSFVEEHLSEGRDATLQRLPGRSGLGVNRSGSALGGGEDA